MNRKALTWSLGIVLLAGLLLPANAFCGNRRMIESQVERLKRLNEQALKQVPNLPASGQVRLKAEVLPGPAPRKIVIQKSEVTPRPTSFKSSLRSYITQGPTMAALTPPDLEPGHRTLKQGIRRYIKRLN